MNPLVYYFVIAIILGAIGGYYYHEGLNEKTIYERNSYYEILQKHFKQTDPVVQNDLSTVEIENMVDDKDCIYVLNEFDSLTGKTKHTCFLKEGVIYGTEK